MSRRALALGFLLLSTPKVGAQSSFEQSMHEIYKSSYSEEISDELWAEYVRGLRNRTYTVSEGDTLWDLSLIFFGDGNYWSKIWSYNEKLTNPHLISVGQDIAFFSGSMEQPPVVRLQNQGEAAEKPEPSKPEGFDDFNLVEGGELSPGVKPQKNQMPDAQALGGLYPGAPGIPAPRNFVRPPLEELPGSFEEFDGFQIQRYEIQDISMDLRPPVQVNPFFVAQSFLYARAPDTYPRLGRILESEQGNTFLGLNDKIYIEMKEDVQLGEKFTILTFDYKFDRNGVYGSVIRYAARVELTSHVRDKIYLGEIYYSLSGVRPGSWISREPIPSLADDHSGRPSNLKLDIIGGGIDNKSKIYGNGDIVYLRGGSSDGLQAGDILGVYKNRRIRYRETQIGITPTPIGHIKVFRAGPKLSSAFVISANDEILPGDITGTPTRVEGLAGDSEKQDLSEIEAGLDFENSFEIR